jgi:3-oxoacyl-[acyl-carrier protein] reductase
VSGIDGRVALVTGASRGIGRGIALALAQAGAVVIGTGTTAASAEAFQNDLAAGALKGSGIAMNVNDPAQIDSALAQIQRDHGDIEILVNNAGITRDNLLLRMKDDEWNEIVSTNLTSVFRLSKAVLRGMIKARHGRIINITSVIASMGNAGQTNYAAAKSGVEGFTRSLAREVGSRNVTVNSVAPGFIETDMTRGLTDELRKTLTAQIPLARLGSVDDVAQAVLFLASAGASYITGCTLHVNGGMYME